MTFELWNPDDIVLSKIQILDYITTDSDLPSEGMKEMYNGGYLKEYLPELYALKGCRQNSRSHGETDAFDHTCWAMDLIDAREEVLSFRDVYPVKFGLLLHDIGKPDCSRIDENGEWRTTGHAEIGAEKTKSLVEGLGPRATSAESCARTVLLHETLYTQFAQCGGDYEVFNMVMRGMSKVIPLEILVPMTLCDAKARPATAPEGMSQSFMAFMHGYLESNLFQESYAYYQELMRERRENWISFIEFLSER